jgi:hypothetical protein
MPDVIVSPRRRPGAAGRVHMALQEAGPSPIPLFCIRNAGGSSMMNGST